MEFFFLASGHNVLLNTDGVWQSFWTLDPES